VSSLPRERLELQSVTGPEDPYGGFFGRYRGRLRELHRRLRPRTYLEIGVDAGRSLALALPETLAIGVDPAPCLEVELQANARVLAESSDSFFAHHDVTGMFGGVGIDLAFVDGLHLFEQVLRDLANVGCHLAPGGCVVIHDTLPYNRVMVQRRRTTEKWSGDVWKVVECLRRERPELSLVTIGVPPTGLTLVRGLDPADTWLLDDYEALVAKHGRLPAGGFNRARSQWRVVPDGDDVVAALFETVSAA
jgi:hypothetical protein